MQDENAERRVPSSLDFNAAPHVAAALATTQPATWLHKRLLPIVILPTLQSISLSVPSTPPPSSGTNTGINGGSALAFSGSQAAALSLDEALTVLRLIVSTGPEGRRAVNAFAANAAQNLPAAVRQRLALLVLDQGGHAPVWVPRKERDRLKPAAALVSRAGRTLCAALAQSEPPVPMRT